MSAAHRTDGFRRPRPLKGLRGWVNYVRDRRDEARGRKIREAVMAGEMTINAAREQLGLKPFEGIPEYAAHPYVGWAHCDECYATFEATDMITGGQIIGEQP